MSANTEHNGILAGVVQFFLNVGAIVTGLVLVGGLLFILVTRAKPEPPAPSEEEKETAAVAAVTRAAITPIAQATPTVPAVGPAEGSGPELVVKGKELFNAQGCIACHTIEGISAGQVGPNLTNIGAVAVERAKEAGADSVAAYIRDSIVDPNAFIAPECPAGPCVAGIMPATFGQTLSDEEIEALVEFLLAQKGGG